ncbi:hypothetical protein [Listeria booriae]|uniref:hypothetical protein n=1 Tax=Listeria booriae TaxID=1552123 RepID=UPI001624F332|nr:hypothetical protein [Listeria booriae]MBC1511769.1 hypothetical protein [Listeria booriae]MBC6150328.1 hypothetical protein [Listeria booriae]MBC6304815.1 hypothetical protein [Listeria booriae]
MEIELDHIFFFREVANGVANEIGGTVIEIMNGQYERIPLNNQVGKEMQLEEVHRSIQKNSLKQQILAIQLEKKKEFRATFFPMSEEAIDQMLQMLHKFRKQFDAEIEEMGAKEQGLLEEEQALFSLRKKNSQEISGVAL